MKLVKAFILAAFLLAAFILLVIVAVQPAVIKRDAPRDLPWKLPDYSLANTSWHIDDGGKFHTSVEHFFLRDISPQMLSWFYQQLPIATVRVAGVSLPLYHIFHPSEHGQLRVVAPAPSGLPGMAEGAVIERREWFGDFDSQGRAKIVEFSDAGMLAIAEIAGLKVGRIHHQFSAREGGTDYRVDSVIGSDLPVIGGLINYYIREQVFHPAFLEQWRRHQVEEVSSLQFFLPAIYSQRNSGTDFVLPVAIVPVN